MPQVLDRIEHTPERAEIGPPRARPVLLATLSVRVDPAAERMAIESALEVQADLIVANVVDLPPYPLTFKLAPEYTTLPHEEDLDAVRATAARAAQAGLKTELLRVSSPRPVTALLELTRERQAGLLVFGPKRSLRNWWRVRRAARAVRKDAPCLVWIAPDG
jgi:nucleotide-binding universal stress UspA family protein